MDIQEASIAFDALSQETRLQVFRLLVEAGPDGVPAGNLSDTLNIPHNTLSFHLRHMTHARLVSAEREGRSIIYSANFSFIHDLIRFMVKNCCNAGFADIQTDNEQKHDIIKLAQCCSIPSKQEKKS